MTDVYSLNLITLVGHIASDIESGNSKKGALFVRFQLATNELFFKRGGEGKPTKNVEFHPIVGWGKMAGQIKKWGSKGKSIIVIGKLRHKDMKQADGTSRINSFVEIQSFTWQGKKKDFEEESVDEEENTDPI